MSRLRHALGLAPILVLAGATFAADRAVAAPSQQKVEPRVEMMASGRIRHPALALRSSTLPLVVELDAPPTAADIARIEAAGATVVRGDSGRVLGHGRRISVEASPSAAAALGGLPGVSGVRFDGPPIRSPRPLDLTASLISADATWRSKVADDGAFLTGSGITICDVDNGVDVSHPMFFRADGGTFQWIDDNDSGALEPDVDTIDLGDGPVPLRMLNGIVRDRRTGDPLWDTEGPTFDSTYDYIYADLNGDGKRNYGVAEGFTEAYPGYGEPMFVLDDVDDSGSLDVGEKLVLLKTSKVKAFRIDGKVYRRGENLIEAPWEDEMLHGVGSSGTMVAGQPGYSKLVGMAPDADLILATDTLGYRQVQMTNFCVDQGARVVLHEYAPWVGYHLDGSSDLEVLIDETSPEGVVHINPAGNLSTSKKLYKHTAAAGATTPISIQAPNDGASYMGLSLLWQDTSRNLDLTLHAPTGTSFTLPLENPQGFQTELEPGILIAGYRQDSPRGTAMVMLYVYSEDGPPVEIPSGTYTLDVTEPAATTADPLPLIAYVQDEVSGWGLGIHFPEDSSEDHLIGWPGTADHGLAVAAFTGHPFDGAKTGERAWYSGRGTRIDGEPILWISAPDNPVVPARFGNSDDIGYMIYGGTSGASPHVAGASALVVQSNPTLTGDGVKEALRAGAVVDDDTGTVPNEDYGYGKLDVYRAIFGEAPPGGAAPVVDNQSFSVLPGPSSVAVVATDVDGDDVVLEADRDYDGVYDETLVDGALAVDLEKDAAALVKVRATDTTGRTDEALVRVSADGVANPDDGDDDGDGPSTEAEDGCCSASGADRPKTPALAAFALLLGVLVRRRTMKR
ncbi:MAG: S8 family serine peptidase [Polyangiaceae bacterium]|nr:S8 family serine peptidase [Polyangiaceae bacterium]